MPYFTTHGTWSARERLFVKRVSSTAVGTWAEDMGYAGNDFNEGTSIEAFSEYDFSYLEAVAEVMLVP